MLKRDRPPYERGAGMVKPPPPSSSPSYLTPPRNYPTPPQSHYTSSIRPHNAYSPISANASAAPVSFGAIPPSLETQKSLEETIHSADIHTLRSLLLASCNLYPHMRKTTLRYILGDEYVEEPPVLGSTIDGVPRPTSTAWPASPALVLQDVELPRLRGSTKSKGKTPLKEQHVPGKGLVIDLLSSDDAAAGSDEVEGGWDRKRARQLQVEGDGIPPGVNKKRKITGFKLEKKTPEKFAGGKCGACGKKIADRYADSACRYHPGKWELRPGYIKAIDNGACDELYPGKSKAQLIEMFLHHDNARHWGCCGKNVTEIGCKTANDHRYEQIRI
ncbi:hypothetical protein ACMFMG_000317 [Clarireedia jacksonii]